MRLKLWPWVVTSKDFYLRTSDTSGNVPAKSKNTDSPAPTPTNPPTASFRRQAGVSTGVFSLSPKIYPHFCPFFKLEVVTELLHQRYTVFCFVFFLKGGYKLITNNFLPFCFIHKISTKYLLKLKVVGGQFSQVSWMMHTFPHFCFFSRNFDLFLLGIRSLWIRNV